LYLNQDAHNADRHNKQPCLEPQALHFTATIFWSNLYQLFVQGLEVRDSNPTVGAQAMPLQQQTLW